MQEKYNIENSNIALLGSELEHHIREHAGDSDPQWITAGTEPGLQIWRVEHFNLKPWPQEKVGTFYDGDSYIVLHTYKPEPDNEELAFNLHFWLGKDTSADEAGTAAFKTVELDDHLHGKPIQYREVQGHESTLFLSHFPKFHCLHGGISTGFHHVTEPPQAASRLFLIKAQPECTNHSLIYEVPVDAASLQFASVFVLDKGEDIWQYNRRDSPGKLRFQAAEFVRILADSRRGRGNVQVYDEGGVGAGIFLSEFGVDMLEPLSNETFRDATGVSVLKFSIDGFTETEEGMKLSDLKSDGIYIVDAMSHGTSPRLYVWIGSEVSSESGRRAIQIGQDYLNQHQECHRSSVIARVSEGREVKEFISLFI